MKILWLIILAIIQGITEFLPISSSGHIVLFDALQNNSIDNTLIFNAAILLHGGSLIAVILYYRKKLLSLLVDFFSIFLKFLNRNRYKQNFMGDTSSDVKSNSKFINKPNTLNNYWDRKKSLTYIAYLLLATAITFTMYLLLNTTIETQFASPKSLYIAFLITTLLLFSTFFTLSFYKKNKTLDPSAITEKNITFPIIVGLFQGLALFPGVSRSGATISSSLYQNVGPEEAAEFSFLLFIIAETAALFMEIKKYSFQLPFSIVEIIIMVAASCIVSLFCLVILKKILQRNKLFGFGFYTLIAAVVSFILFR